HYALGKSYPNPFNSTTTIRYQLPETSDVSILIYNISGRVVKTLVDRSQPAGRNTIIWDGNNDNGEKVSSGIYFVRTNIKSQISNSTYTETQKILYLH
ncbi:MAG: FlgD immunoglobulin-like domain containing protein, partial [bacterium]